MPANVTPEYERAERRYRESVSDDERLAALQEMLSTIPKHKGTEKMQADIKRRISQLRKSQEEAKHKKGLDPFHISRGGAGQVVLVGPPNTGKSSLVAATTNAEVKVAEYPFTTVLPMPGMWQKGDRQIELVDMPPLAPEHVVPGFMGAVRSADVVCLVVEAGEAALDQVEMILGLMPSGFTLETVPRNLLDARDHSRRSGLIVANKVDLASAGHVETLRGLYASRLEVIEVSARKGEGLEALFERLWELLAVIRVYSKRPGKQADLDRPFTVPAGSSIEDLARHIHRDLPGMMKHARLWRPGRPEGQLVHRTELLRDKDIVEIHE
jgi:ribosome-interacting GTPase 1